MNNKGLSFNEVNTIIEDSYEEKLHKEQVNALRKKRGRKNKGGNKWTNKQ